MSGLSSPVSGKQEKTMSSRLLTMKFMQRAAASSSHRVPAASSPLSGDSPRDINGHSAKRQKLTCSFPISSDDTASSPRPLPQSSIPSTPLFQERTNTFTLQEFGGNEAETPWVLNALGSADIPDDPPSPLEDTSLQDTAIGRRTFGDFRKKATEKAATTRNRKDESVSPMDSEDCEEFGEKMRTRTPKDKEKPKGKSHRDHDDNKMDQIKLKRVKSGGISASSCIRRPGFAGKKDKRKG